jgi:hypothetical protein
MTRQEAIKMAIEAGWRAASAVFDDAKLLALPAEVGEYICNRGEPTAGETVWRRAAALGLLSQYAEEWQAQPPGVRLAYTIFAETTFTTFEMLRGFGMVVEATPPRGPSGMADQAGEGGLAEQICGPMRPMGERLPEHVEALALGAKKTKRQPTADEMLGEELGAMLSRTVTVESDRKRVHSVGERPVAHNGRPKTGGARPVKEEQPDD